MSSTASSQTEDCPICLTAFAATKPGGEVIQTQCQHSYHGTCLHRWLATGDDRCPMCRQPVVVEISPGNYWTPPRASIVDWCDDSDAGDGDDDAAEDDTDNDSENDNYPTALAFQPDEYDPFHDYAMRIMWSSIMLGDEDMLTELLSDHFVALNSGIREIVLEEYQLRAAILSEDSMASGQ
jgi:hypothetical protein